MNPNLFSTESETAVLSTILQYPETVYELVSLKPMMFSSNSNQELYQAIQDLVSEGLVPDTGLVENSLKNRGRLEKVGGSEYLEYLVSQNQAPENLKEFSDIVINSYKARSLISMTSTLQNRIETLDDVDFVLGDLRRSIDALSENTGGDKTVSLGDLVPKAWEDITSRLGKEITGISTGIKSLDGITGGYLPGLYFIISRPSMGKTAVICNSKLAVAKAGYPCLTFSLEMNKEQLVDRLLAIETGLQLTNIRFGNLSKEDLEQIKNALVEMKDYPMYLDTNFGARINYISSTIRKYHRNFGVQVVFIDYVQLLVERDDQSTHELGRISRELKLLANELGISIIVASQLNRNVEMREDKRPILSDIRQSGNLEEDSDIVISLYRDEYYNRNSDKKNQMELNVLKHRNGPTGLIAQKFDMTTNQLFPL